MVLDSSNVAWLRWWFHMHGFASQSLGSAGLPPHCGRIASHQGAANDGHRLVVDRDGGRGIWGQPARRRLANEDRIASHLTSFVFVFLLHVNHVLNHLDPSAPSAAIGPHSRKPVIPWFLIEWPPWSEACGLESSAEKAIYAAWRLW